MQASEITQGSAAGGRTAMWTAPTSPHKPRRSPSPWPSALPIMAQASASTSKRRHGAWRGTGVSPASNAAILSVSIAVIRVAPPRSGTTAPPAPAATARRPAPGSDARRPEYRTPAPDRPGRSDSQHVTVPVPKTRPLRFDSPGALPRQPTAIVLDFPPGQLKIVYIIIVIIAPQLLSGNSGCVKR